MTLTPRLRKRPLHLPLLYQLSQPLPPLPLHPLILRIDKPINLSVIRNSLLGIVLALLIRLRPVVAVQLAVSFAARTRYPGHEGFGLHEVLVAVAAFDPAVVGGGKEGAAEVVVAWSSGVAASFAFFVLILVVELDGWDRLH